MEGTFSMIVFRYIAVILTMHMFYCGFLVEDHSHLFSNFLQQTNT